MKQQNLNSVETTSKLNIAEFVAENLNSAETTSKLNVAEFLAEYFTGSTSVKGQFSKGQFSYGLLWDAITSEDHCESISIMVDHEQKKDDSFYYEYGLLKAEEEMEADREVLEKNICGTWMYRIRYQNPDEKLVSFYFYTKTRITAFIQHENEALEVAWEMQEITKQKPILCLESHTVLFCRALDCIMESYSKVCGYSDEDMQKEYCPDVTEVAAYKMQYKFAGSYDYRINYCHDGYVTGNNVRNAIDAAWTWFHTGFVNNFISKDPETKSLNLNW